MVLFNLMNGWINGKLFMNQDIVKMKLSQSQIICLMEELGLNLKQILQEIKKEMMHLKEKENGENIFLSSYIIQFKFK